MSTLKDTKNSVITSRAFDLLKLITALTLCLYSIGSHAVTLEDKLTDLGHPNTKLCHFKSQQQGLGKYLVVQFKKRVSDAENSAATLSLLKIFQPATQKAGQHFVGINATEQWNTCFDKTPNQIYWLNYDSNWQEVDRKPEKFLKRLRKNLRSELRGTPSEAYILTSLGQVEERLGKFQSSIKRFEQAWPMLRDSNDPHNQKSSVLAPLFLHYIQPKRDQEKGQAYLNEYAIVVTANSTEKTEYLPIARVTPIYPRSAQKRGLEGYVEMEFTVTAEGRVKNPVITRASPKGVFEQAALKAAENFLYVPKVIDGKRVAVEGVTNKITFEINR